jgi:hypothetical protein
MVLKIKSLQKPENSEKQKKRPPCNVSTLRSRIVDYISIIVLDHREA